ncbi:MAG: T9SS type A sorting domain-containing protein [Bacteroidales bacterium]|nr:T9SS type A sorting domain-containing protein [Bacteroidales bacterium]
MKKLFLALFIIFFYVSVKSGFSQEDEFLIGAWLTPYDLMYHSGYGTANIELNDSAFHIWPISSAFKYDYKTDAFYKTSRINVLKEFGVNFIWMQSPSPWALSGVASNDSLFRLLTSNDVRGIGDIDYWFNPTKTKVGAESIYINTIGEVDFNGTPDWVGDSSNNLGRPNYNKIIPLMDQNPNVYGYVLGGELGYRSGHYYNITGERVLYEHRKDSCFTSEISPNTLWPAFDLVDEMSTKKIILQVGTHSMAINDYTDDWRYWDSIIDQNDLYCAVDKIYNQAEDTLDVDPQDHFTNPQYYPDLVIEGSYYDLSLSEREVNGFSYPTTCFYQKYTNMLNCGISPDGFALDGNDSNCPIRNVNTKGRCIDSMGNEFYGDHRHYLSKFHNIDYFRNKGIDVISEFSSFHTKYSTDSGIFESSMGHWNSTSIVDNANHFWFNAYNSLIHGVVGVIPYVEYKSLFRDPCNEMLALVKDLEIDEAELKYRVYWDAKTFFNNIGINNSSEVKCDCDENYSSGIPGSGIPDSQMDKYRHLMATAASTLIYSYGDQFEAAINPYWTNGSKERFDYKAWPASYKNYIAPLYDEFSFLKNKGFLNSDNIKHRKLDHEDSNSIVPKAKDYIISYEENCVGVPEIYIDFINTSLLEEGLSNSNIDDAKTRPVSFEEEFSNENYGLRYVLLSNDEVNDSAYALIISNPLNVPLLNVPISVREVSYLKDYNYAYMLFNNESNVVYDNFKLDSSYKNQRNFGVRYTESDLKQIPSVKLDIDPVSNSFSLNFGPLDVHVILFSNEGFNWCDHSTQRFWSNFNSSAVGGHKLGYYDQPAVVGDFYGSSSEELLLINLRSNWVTTQMYVNDDFTNAFNNSGNGWINRQPEGWKLGAEDVFIAGNFIDNSSGDELLCIQDYQNQSTNRAAAMIGFNDITADWDYWFWSNPNDRGKIGDWILTRNTKYFVGNFDDDELSEVLFVRYIANMAHVMIQKYDESENEWVKLLETRLLDISVNSKIIVGDFDKNRIGDEIFITDGDGASLYLVSNGMLNKYWDNEDFPGYLNVMDKTNWELSSTDNLVSGSYFKRTKLNPDDLLIVRDPLYTVNKDEPSAAFFHFDSESLSWEVLWDNNNCGNNMIADWSVFDKDAIKNEYFSIDIYPEKGGIANALYSPKKLFAFRNSDSHIASCDPSFIARMYSFNDSDRLEIPYKTNNTSALIESEQIIFRVKPNPTTGLINISNNQGYKIESISIFNLYGESLLEIDKVGHSNVDLNISNLPSGTYFVKIVSEGRYFHEVIIKH